MLRPARLQLPVRRVLAVDAGSRRLKLTLVKSSFGRVQILREESIDLSEEGLVTTDELKNQLQTVLEDWGHPPLALTLSEHLSTSHIIELPQAPESEVRKLIEDEAVKLSGVSDSAIVYDFVRVESAVPNRQQFWVTLAKERDIEERVKQLGFENADLCDVSTTANALAAAYRAASPESSAAVLVHFGAQNTLIVVLAHAQTIYAGSFPVGGDNFTRTVAAARNCTVEEAESFKREINAFTGAQSIPELAELVDGWAAEIQRQIRAGLAPGPDAIEIPALPLVASGVGFDQPGLLEYLQRRHDLSVAAWPAHANLPARGLEIAYGTALQALGLTTQPISLLPATRRVVWQQQLTTQKFAVANVALLALCFVMLGIGIWQKFSLVREQKSLLTKIEAGSEMLRLNQTLSARLQGEYENLRPLLQYRQNTRDVLETLALLEQTRSNRSFWYVLLADQHSYFQQSAETLTNLAPPFIAPASSSPWLSFEGPFPSVFATNGSPAKPGLIVELCVPENLYDARRILSSIVNDLKPAPIFSKVDLLSDDLRRDLADPKVILASRHFALSLDFAATEFHPVKPAPRSRADSSPARGNRWARPGPEKTEAGSPLLP